MGEHAAGQIDPPEDTHGSSDYRRRLTATLVSRALAQAAELSPGQDSTDRDSTDQGDPGRDGT
jgi:hypothetical protein